MKKSRFTEEQIAFPLRQAEGGARVRDVCHEVGITLLAVQHSLAALSPQPFIRITLESQA